MTAPFQIVHRDGVAWVDRKVDQAFRNALLAGVPVVLRPKMRMALAANVNPREAIAHSKRYFGAELPAIVERTTPLLQQLDQYLANQHGLKGLFDWLDVTGFGSHYEMIKVFDRWASEYKLPDPTVH